MPSPSTKHEMTRGRPRHGARPVAWTGLLSAAVLASTLTHAGCGPQPSASTAQEANLEAGIAEQTSENPERGREKTKSKSQALSPVKLRETWEAVYMGGTKIGTVHTLFESVQQNSRTMIKASSQQELTISRAGQKTRMRTRVESTETEQGALRSFTVETSVGPTPLVTRGTYHDGALHLVTSNHGQRRESTIPWDDRYGGFFALEQSLSKQPMQSGEQRELTMLMPWVGGVQIVTTTLTAEGEEKVDVLDGSKQLLKIVMKNRIGNEEIDAVCWTAADGAVLKTALPALQQTIYRTTKTRAQAAESGDYDLFWDSIVPITSPLPHPHELTRGTYEVSLPEKNPEDIFVCGGSQRVEQLDHGTAKLTVVAVRPDSQLADAKGTEPGPHDSSPNSLIQADDPRIVRMARELIGTETDPWAKCVALEQGVYQAIESKNFGHGFATAADVVRSREGDCTEHAVLLAALCRAEGIPARVALGLVYSPSNQGFAFHMWNEAWVRDRWIPLDATLGHGGIGAAHLKLRHSNLANEAAESAILSVVQVINQLEIKVLETQTR